MNLIHKLFQWETTKTEEKVTAPTLETPVCTNLALKLRDAEARFNASTLKKELLFKRIDIGERGVAELEKALRDPDVQLRGRKVQAVTETRWRLERLRSEVPATNNELAAAERELAAVRCEVSENSDYIAALQEQAKLVLEAYEIALGAWRARLCDVQDVIKKYDAVADREINFVLTTNTRFTRLGLPEIREKINGSRHALPLFVANFPLDILGRGAREALERLASIAARLRGF